MNLIKTIQTIIKQQRPNTDVSIENGSIIYMDNYVSCRLEIGAENTPNRYYIPNSVMKNVKTLTGVNSTSVNGGEFEFPEKRELAGRSECPFKGTALWRDRRSSGVKNVTISVAMLQRANCFSSANDDRKFLNGVAIYLVNDDEVVYIACNAKVIYTSASFGGEVTKLGVIPNTLINLLVAGEEEEVIYTYCPDYKGASWIEAGALTASIDLGYIGGYPIEWNHLFLQGYSTPVRATKELIKKAKSMAKADYNKRKFLTFMGDGKVEVSGVKIQGDHDPIGCSIKLDLNSLEQCFKSGIAERALTGQYFPDSRRFVVYTMANEMVYMQREVE